MSTESFGTWFRRHSYLDYYNFMKALEDRGKMKNLLSSNPARMSAKKKLKTRQDRRVIKKRRSKTRVGRLKGVL